MTRALHTLLVWSARQSTLLKVVSVNCESAAISSRAQLTDCSACLTPLHFCNVSALPCTRTTQRANNALWSSIPDHRLPRKFSTIVTCKSATRNCTAHIFRPFIATTNMSNTQFLKLPLSGSLFHNQSTNSVRLWVHLLNWHCRSATDKLQGAAAKLGLNALYKIWNWCEKLRMPILTLNSLIIISNTAHFSFNLHFNPCIRVNRINQFCAKSISKALIAIFENESSHALQQIWNFVARLSDAHGHGQVRTVWLTELDFPANWRHNSWRLLAISQSRRLRRLARPEINHASSTSCSDSEREGLFSVSHTVRSKITSPSSE